MIIPFSPPFKSARGLHVCVSRQIAPPSSKFKRRRLIPFYPLKGGNNKARENLLPASSKLSTPKKISLMMHLVSPNQETPQWFFFLFPPRINNKGNPRVRLTAIPSITPPPIPQTVIRGLAMYKACRRHKRPEAIIKHYFSSCGRPRN